MGIHPGLSTGNVFVILIVSSVIGNMKPVQPVRDAPKAFVDEVDAAVEKDVSVRSQSVVLEYLGKGLSKITRDRQLDLESIGMNFRTELEDGLNIDMEQTDPEDVFEYLILDLEGSMSRKTRRLEIRYSFQRNLDRAAVSSFVLSIAILLTSILFSLIDYGDPATRFVLIVFYISSYSIFLAMLLKIFSLNLGEKYTESLLREYHFNHKLAGAEEQDK
ncbi:hypothetical protein KVP02_03260 [Halobacterium salinarum]|uniref:hypothetical protein n=1 Tax=Halobacterium salinarum TaxID=2242 RepID=UPI001F3BCC90|nr:hypothetical protein [Halobacterium salinarum]MCF2206687.1 hypothetical protein [Halobacterium salinarum]